MSVKVIITENQLEILKSHLNEMNAHESLVEKLSKDLDMNYEPMLGIVREDGEYHEEPMLKVKADNNPISPKELYEYFKKKYNLGDAFTKQVIQDWMYGKIKDNRLSKNVAIN